MDPVTLRVSDVVAFEGCKRKWWWGHQWDSWMYPPALFIGTAVHAGLQAYYETNRSRLAAVTAIDAHIERIFDTWDDRYPVQHIWETTAEDDARLAKGLVDHYCRFDEKDYLAGDVIDVEHRVTVPIRDPHGQDHPNIFLSGKLDVVLDDAAGEILVDHKTFGERTLADDPAEALDRDEALTAYCYLRWRETGKFPRRAMYNVLVKALPAPPRVLKNGELSCDKSQATTGLLFREAIKERNLQIARYLDHLAWLDAQGYGRYFQRWVSTRNAAEVHAFERRLAYKAEHVLQLVGNPDAYAYPSGSSYRCGRCPFGAPCKAQDAGEDAATLLAEMREKELWSIEE